MIVLYCDKEDCKGHLVAWNYKGKPVVLPNKDHKAGKIELTDELKKRLSQERGSEPFRTFMDVVEEETTKK